MSTTSIGPRRTGPRSIPGGPKDLEGRRTAVSLAGSLWLGVGFGLATWLFAGTSGSYLRTVALAAAALCLVALVIQSIEQVLGVAIVALVARASLDAVVFFGSRTAGTGLSEVVGVLLIVVGVTFLLGEVLRRRLVLSAVSTGALVFLGVVALSVPRSLSPGISVTATARVAAYVLLFVVLDTLVRRRRVEWTIVGATLVSAAVPLLVGTWQLASGTGLLERGGFPSVVATFVHPNTFARYLGLIVVIGVAVFPVVPRAWRTAMVVAAPLVALNLVQTYARAAWISTLLGIVIVIGLRRRRVLPSVMIAAALVLGSMMVPSVGDRFSDLATAQVPDNREVSNSLDWRVMHWERLTPLATRNPVTGIGAGASDDANRGGKAPHNDYLRAVIELGWIGGLGYFAFLILLIRRARRALRAAVGERERALAIGFVGAVATVVVVSVTENLMYQVVFMTYFLAFAAAVRGALPEDT